jgi:hypothetical protein
VEQGCREWCGVLQRLLRRRNRQTKFHVHRRLGVWPTTLVWLWAWMEDNWPSDVPVSKMDVAWTLWYLREYPNDPNIIDKVKTSTPFYRTIWQAIFVLAERLPQVLVWCLGRFLPLPRSHALQPPFEKRFEYHAGPPHLQLEWSCVLDTMVLTCETPGMTTDEFWNKYRVFKSQNPKKPGYGLKLEVAASMERYPKLIWFNVAPAGFQDTDVSKMPGGFCSRLFPGERVLTDPDLSYSREPWCRAPPNKASTKYVEEFDKFELTLQRAVERVNAFVSDFKFARGPFRKSPSEPDYYKKHTAGVAVVCKLISIDQRLNPPHVAAVNVLK